MLRSQFPRRRQRSCIARLTEQGIDCQLVEHAPGQKYSLYFYDPNGIRLELFWQPADGEEPRVIDALTQTKVKAREELQTLTADEAWLEWATAGLPSSSNIATKVYVPPLATFLARWRAP